MRKVSRLGHLEARVNNLDPSLPFYRNILGWR
ncbi:MAG: VOC family protein [Candidatus Binatia bacterium]